MGEPETGPQLLSSLQLDEPVGTHPAWTTRRSTNFHPNFGVVCVSSNLWPGAHAYSDGRSFANIYVGYGHKFATEPYSPPAPPPSQQEYAGEDIAESTDPSREEELAVEEAKRAAEGE